MLCLLSSFFYAAYTVALRKLLPADDQASVSVFFGFIGMLNLIGMAPVLLLLWLTSAVDFHGVTAWLVFLAVCKGKPVVRGRFCIASSYSAALNMRQALYVCVLYCAHIMPGTSIRLCTTCIINCSAKTP